jgi:hypothetical protein
LWSVVAFFLAEKILKKRWRSAVEHRLPLNGEIHRFLSRRTTRWRKALRSRVLEQNAFQWLAQRRQRPALLAWGGIFLICFIWLLGWCAWPHAWPSNFNFFLTAMLLLLFERTLQTYSAARQIGEDRRNGTLELILTTLLTPNQILAGQLDALEEQFRVVRRALCGIFLLMALAGLVMRSWTPSALILYVAIWSLFFSFSLRRSTGQNTLTLWVALNTGRPAFAVFRSQNFGWQWIWIFYNASRIRSALGSSATAQFPTGSLAEYCAFGFVAFLMCLVYAVRWKNPALLRERFIDNMRSIAQEPVPGPQDERLKRWKDVRELLPAAAK